MVDVIFQQLLFKQIVRSRHHKITNMATVVIDTHKDETFLATQLQELDTQRQRLDVGDVLISCGESKFVVERKTVADLANSIGSNRWKQQKARLLAHDQDATPILLMQGVPPRWSANVVASGITGKALHASLTHTALQGIAVMWAPSEADVAEAIKKLASLAESPSKLHIKSVNQLDNTKKRKRDAPVFASMLSMVAGLTYEGALELSKSYPTFESLKNADVKALAKVQLAKRPVGKALASKLIAAAK